MITSSPRVTRQQQEVRDRRPSGRIRPSDNLVRSMWASALAADTHVHGSAAQIIRRKFEDDDVSPIVLRSAVVPADHTTWAGQLAAQAPGDFLATLVPIGAAAKLLAAGVTVPLAGQDTVRIPRRSGLPKSTLPWIGPGGAIPVTQASLASTTLTLKKVAAIVTMTREVLEGPTGEQVLGDLVRDDLSATLDATMFSATAGSSLRPPGLLNGITPASASTGGGSDAMVRDLEVLASKVIAGGGNLPVYVAALPQAAAILLRLQTADRFTVIPCSALAAGTVVALDPAALVSCSGPAAEFYATSEALIHSDDAATEIASVGSPNTVAAPVRSLFQTDSFALKLIVRMDWAMAVPAVAVVNSVTWGTAS